MAHPFVELCFAQAGDEDHGVRHEHRDGRERVDPQDAEFLASLAARIQQGDEAAFETLFRESYPRLVRFAAAYVDGDAAADVVAEVFIALWKRHTEWVPDDVQAFLYRAVRNRALNSVRGSARELHRRETYHTSAQEPATDLAGRSDDDPRTAAVRIAVTELSPRQREFIVLRWQEGRTPAEIAALLGTTVRAITSLQDRTIAALRRRAPQILAKLQSR